MICLEHRLPEISVELTQLLDFLRTVGLDVSGTGTQLLRSRHRSCVLEIEGYRSAFPDISNLDTYFSSKRSTAQSLAMILAQDAPDSFPIHSYFKGFELENYCSTSFPVSMKYSAHGKACQRQRAAAFFRLNPSLAFGKLSGFDHNPRHGVLPLSPSFLEPGSLEDAVIHRDVAELKSVLRKRSFDPREYKWTFILANLELSAFQLAMDWQEGIEELLTKFAPTAEDIEFAIHIDTPLSLEILRTLWHRMCGPLNYRSLFQILPESSDRARSQVLELMQESRLRLHQFAMISLNDSEKSRLCLTSHCAADWKTSEVWATLIKQGCRVPLRYEPMHEDFIFSLMNDFRDVQSLLWQVRRGKGTCSKRGALQNYFDLGFLKVNCQRLHAKSTRLDHMQAAQTPFLTFLESFDNDYERDGWFPEFAEVCLWFLENGAAAQSFGPYRRNLLFILARFVAMDCWNLEQNDDTLRRSRQMNLYKQQKLWMTALERCSADQVDVCRCFCSVAGCLPSRLFLQSRGFRTLYRLRIPRAVLDERLLLWFGLCRLSEEQKARYVEDAVRLEAFTRLGMTHTCCHLSDESVWTFSGSHTHTSDDIKEIQFEECELRGHLDLIMAAYRCFSKGFENWNACLSKWWTLLEGILPDLSGLINPMRLYFRSEEAYERAVHDAEQDRATLEAQTLQSNGYEGMDFLDIIRLHFSKYLQDRNGVAVE